MASENSPRISVSSQSEKTPLERILTINGGSSSVKFAVYGTAEPMMRLLSGKIERVGLSNAAFTIHEPENKRSTVPVDAKDCREAGQFLLDWIAKNVGFRSFAGVGHRFVHGGANFKKPHWVTPELLAELEKISPFDLEHLPSEIQFVKQLCERCPYLPQVACFDTAFHAGMPQVARLLPIPRRYYQKGVQRYGFHGLSYAYLMEELARVAGADVAKGRVILAHLGNGASLAAVRGGKGVDTSMAFTPTAGVPMSTRAGDLDPGLVWYFASTEKLNPEQFHHMVNHESGLLGVSETSGDVRDLLASEATDIRAAEALELFCYQVKKWIGAFAAALGGLETLVFSGGIGENMPVLRNRICSGLEFLGLRIDQFKNDANAPIISHGSSRVTARMIRTDEEVMIAKAVRELLGESNSKKTIVTASSLL